MATQKAVHEQPADIEAVEAILEDLDLEEVQESDIDELVEAEASEGEEIDEENVSDDELHELDMQIEREALYAEQKSELEADAGAAKAAKEDRAKNPFKVKSGAKKSTAPRAPKDLNAVASEFFVLEGDVASMSDTDKDAAKTATMTLAPTQKKIAEKFENLFTSLSAGKTPSVYVVQAFKLLDAKRSMSSTELVADFKGTYSQGTAMSQAGQIMNLFATVKIADRTKNVLTLNGDSVIAQRLRDVINAPKL